MRRRRSKRRSERNIYVKKSRNKCRKPSILGQRCGEKFAAENQCDELEECVSGLVCSLPPGARTFTCMKDTRWDAWMV